MPKSIYLDQSVVPKDKKYTFLTGDVFAGATSIGISSTLGFVSLTTASGQILLIGELGQERSEIIKTSSSSGPGGVSVSLASVLRFDHPQDTKVYIIDWDRFEVQHASTVSGTKSTLTAYPENLQPDQIDALYRDTTKTSGFYFIRFNETVGNTNSDWSDPIPYSGFPDNTVKEIKERALEQMNETVDGVLISNEYLDRCLWQARREHHQSPGKRPFRRKFNTYIGNVLTGSYRIDLPLDVERPFTAENVFNVRIGTQPNLSYMDKKVFDFYYVGKPHSTLDLPYTRNASTSIWLANGRDFSESASITVEGTVISLSRITGERNSFYIISHGDWSASGGSDVWENISLGLPDKFTVWADVGGSAYVYFNRPFETSYANQSIYLDYYRTVVDKDSDYDELDEPDYDIYVPYLRAMIKKRINPDLDLLQDSDYKEWLIRKQTALDKEYAGTEIRLVPNIEHLLE